MASYMETQEKDIRIIPLQPLPAHVSYPGTAARNAHTQAGAYAWLLGPVAFSSPVTLSSIPAVTPSHSLPVTLQTLGQQELPPSAPSVSSTPSSFLSEHPSNLSNSGLVGPGLPAWTALGPSSVEPAVPCAPFLVHWSQRQARGLSLVTPPHAAQLPGLSLAAGPNQSWVSAAPCWL